MTILKSKKVTLLLFIFGIIMLCGCTNKAFNKSNRNDGHDIKASVKDEQQADELSLSKIIANEAATDDRQTLDDTIIHMIDWELSNGEKMKPAKKDVLLKSALGKRGLIAVKVPKTVYPRWNIFHLSYTNKNKWVINIVTDGANDNPSNHISGLNLPMEKYTIMSNNNTEDKEKRWSIFNDDKVIVICKYPVFNFAPAANTERTSLKDRVIYIQTDNGQTTLYYYENGNVIWLSGNISKEEMKKLAASLPSSESADFPGEIE